MAHKIPSALLLCLCCTPLLAAEPAPVKKIANQYSAGDLKVPGAHVDEPVIEYSADKAAQYLSDGAVAWSRKRKCVTCHTNGTYLFIRPALTATLGAPEEELRTFFEDELIELQEMDVEKQQIGARPASAIYMAAGLAEWDAHVSKSLSKECRSALEFMFSLQTEDGTWNAADCWPPLESSAYQEATMAAMAVAAAPGWLESLTDEKLTDGVNRMKAYIRDTTPPHDYGRALQLWASLRLNGILTAEQQADTIKMLSTLQLEDGGWSLRTFATPETWGSGNRAEKLREEKDFESPASDGHMTGLALLILQEADIANDDDRIVRGLNWLKKNQRESGRWWTRSLNTDKSHYITFSGTAYPLLALQRAAN